MTKNAPANPNPMAQEVDMPLLAKLADDMEISWRSFGALT